MSWLSLFKPRQEWPEFIERYLQSCQAIKKNGSLDELKFVCFDSESTLLNPSTARLLSLAAVSLTKKGIDVKSSLDCFVQWAGDEKPENVEIHGVTNQQSKEGMAPEEVIKLFLEYIEGAVLVAHNISFDRALFEAIFRKYYGALKLRNPLLDTAKMALRLELAPMDRNNYNSDDYTLDALFNRYNIQPLERHSALGDAYSTALLFMKLKEKLKLRGIVKLNQL